MVLHRQLAGGSGSRTGGLRYACTYGHSCGDARGTTTAGGNSHAAAYRNVSTME